MKKVVLVDDDQEVLSKLSEQLVSQGFEIVGIASDGQTGLNIINETKPDIVVTDIVMPKFDGYWLLEKVSSIHKIKIIVLSALARDAFIAKAIDLGADEYVLKPYDINQLVAKMQIVEGKPVVSVGKNTQEVGALYSQKEEPSFQNKLVRNGKNYKVDEKISNIFITVGIPAHIKGYQFLREAIKLTIDNPEIINSITKKLYPMIAGKYETSASKVERAIRHAIEVAWNRGRIENINTLFGVKVYTQNDRPTNGEFIALIADKMLLEAM
ncbi:MAG: sporulation transcription factor Spo0A [Firmicutes bacterium]|nr:sporulation transcription factor Spo0A [Bacillota bacterium]